MSKLLAQRLTEALDVSGAFDNCFFHSYALHLLANTLELPKDLFTFKSVSGEDSPASKLQTRFPNIELLSLFTEHAELYPEKMPVSPEFIVEKTLIIGLLMREWFATKMAENVDVCDEMQNDARNKFNTYKDFIAFVPKDELLLGAEGVLYSANESFLTYFSTRPKVGSLSHEENRFENYFTNAGDNTDKALTAFWNTEGYDNYCKLIATPGVKLAYADVTPIMHMLNQSLTIYDMKQSVIHKHVGSDAIPEMEVKLNATEGHYYLLKTDLTAPLLNEYENSLKQYKIDRAEILASEGDKNLVASQKTSLFAGAICPSGQLDKEPFTILLDKVDSLKADVSEHQLAQKQQAEAEQEYLRLEQQAAHEQVLKINAQLREEREAEKRRAQEQQVLLLKERQEKPKPATPGMLELAFNEKIALLADKMLEFKGQAECQAAYDALDTLHQALKVEGALYFSAPPSEETFDTFKENCDKHILAARPEIDKHRGWSKILINIAAIVLSAGVGYLIAAGVNLALNKGKFTFFSTDSSLKVDEIAESVHQAAPGA